MFTVKLQAKYKDCDNNEFKNISCLRLSISCNF